MNRPNDISAIFAPYSPYVYISPNIAGCENPVLCRRNYRQDKLYSKGAQLSGGRARHKKHGKHCVICFPRRGAPRKPYRRAKAKKIVE